TSVARVGGDAAALTITLLDTVAATQALEAVPLHHAGETAALRLANDVHRLDVLEDVLDAEQLADGQGVVGLVEAILADVPLRLPVGLGWRGDAGADAGRLAFRLEVGGNVAALRPGGLAAGLVDEAELNGIVAVAFLIADEQDRAGADLEDGDGGDLALVVVD